MNPIWAFFFKDKYNTPFSVFRMSLAEITFLGALIFGVGFGITKGAQAIAEFETTMEVEKE